VLTAFLIPPQLYCNT